MSLPINGRIAIIDDNMEQALPLINVLAQKQCPCSYFSGELKYLPNIGENLNDIRLLFLDINLIDDATHTDKELKAKLIPVLSRVISKDNYPYILIYWSRHENEYSDLVKDIFQKELTDRKPIKYLSQNKLNYFDLNGERTIDFEKNVSILFENITVLINQEPSYNYLLNWENQVHKSADNTLQRVFSAHNSFSNWSDNANFLFNKFGKSYSGKEYFSQSPEEKIKSSFQAFNNVFIDSLEYSTYNTEIKNCTELSYDKNNVDEQAIFSINKNLLISEEKSPIEYSGAVTEDQNQKSDSIFNDVLNNSINRTIIKEKILFEKGNKDKTEKEIRNLTDKKAKEIRAGIKSNWKKIYCVVTPLCDYVQQKYAYCRVVKGMLMDSTYRGYIDDKSEAIFISPEFRFEGCNYILVLHFRYFFTTHSPKGIKYLNPLFRVRLQLLAEIQSKLARHISRQGILFLDNL
ncbi:MAG: hypothetical protein WDO19_18160 [Bacteroidota bacterium]